MAVNFVTYNTAEERLAAFRRSVSLRKEWEAKMAPAMKQYREIDRVKQERESEI